MNLDELTVGQLKQVAALAAGLNGSACAPKKADPSLGKYVVVRTYSAGVHFGVLEARDGQEVLLTEARRLWSWQGANTLHEVATAGVASGSKASDEVPRVTLTQAIEVIECSADGEKKLRASKWAK